MKFQPLVVVGFLPDMETLTVSLLIHLADPESRTLVITIFTYAVRPYLRL